MSAESAKSRFDRALVELQVGLKVLPIGVAETGAWRYSFIYEILQRHYPELPEQARQISRSQAQRTLILQYLKNTVCVDRRIVAKVFHVLNWTPSELSQVINALIQEKLIQEIAVSDSKNPLLLFRYE
jgi:hypothetical protein